MSYIIKKTSDKNVMLESSVWNETESISIDKINWKEYPASVKTEGKVIYNDDGIYVKFISDETPVHINHHEHNGDVFMDSTVEFFVAPDKDSADYFNFEINAEGYILVGYGPGRERLRFSDIDFTQFKTTSNIHDSGFELLLFVPFSFMKEYASKITKDMKANLQKCCEVDGYTHYLTAYPINSEEPEFHLPQYFNDFILE